MTDLKITHADLAAFAERTINLPAGIARDKQQQVNTLRERLEVHIARNPGFSLVKMLHAGSVAKGTALKKVHDFDLAVYVRKDDAPGTEAALIDWLADRLREAYRGLIAPAQVQPGTHCVNITFVATGTSIDVVPVLYEGDPDGRGYLVAKDTGDKLLTSVRLHLDFIRERKKPCALANKNDWAQVVRFVKWWASVQRQRDPGHGTWMKSFLAELLCAHLLDRKHVDFTDYVKALDSVFDYIVRTELNDRIAFTDYYKAYLLPAGRVGEVEVFDPVNPANNVARLYGPDDRKRIVEAAAEALDAITEASRAKTRQHAIDCWQVVLGTSFRG